MIRRSTRYQSFGVTFLLIAVLLCQSVCGFVVRIPGSVVNPNTSRLHQESTSTTNESNSITDTSDNTDIIAKRIIVSGPAVQGGYYRSCVRNEVRYNFSYVFYE